MILNYVVESDIATTQLLEQVLQRASADGFTYKKYYFDALPKNFPEAGSLTLFVRSCSRPMRSVIRYFSRIGAPYAYFIDDNFWEIRGTTQLALYYQNKSVQKTLDAVAANADACLTNSPILESYLKSKAKSTTLLPPFFNFELLQGLKKKSRIVRGEIRIGFAGSTLRVDDVEHIAPALEAISRKFKNVVFEFIGVEPKLKIQPANLRFFNYLNSYEDYLSLQVSRDWHIGLAPLAEGISNSSKTNNKFREYGAMEIPSIYSPRGPYENSVVDGKTGLFADSINDWIIALENLITHEKLRNLISKNAYSEVFSNYAIEKVASTWAATLIDLNRDRNLEKFKQMQARLIFKVDKNLQSAIERLILLRVVVAANGFKNTLKQILISIPITREICVLRETWQIGGGALVFKKTKAKLFHRSKDL